MSRQVIAGKKESALERERSTTADQENDQPTSDNDSDVPERPPEPPKPPRKPAERPRREVGPPSVELEGEWRHIASCEVGRTSAVAGVSGASTGDVDPRDRPKELHNASERVNERSERVDKEDSSQWAPDKPRNPGRRADAPRASTWEEDPRNRSNNLESVRTCRRMTKTKGRR